MKRREDWQKDLDECLRHLETEEDEGKKAIIRDDIAHAQKMLGLVDLLLEKNG